MLFNFWLNDCRFMYLKTLRVVNVSCVIIKCVYSNLIYMECTNFIEIYKLNSSPWKHVETCTIKIQYTQYKQKPSYLIVSKLTHDGVCFFTTRNRLIGWSVKPQYQVLILYVPNQVPLDLFSHAATKAY